MKLAHYRLVGVSLALLLALVPKAHADLIPWAYSWSRSPTDILANAPGTARIVSCSAWLRPYQKSKCSTSMRPVAVASTTSDVVAGLTRTAR